MFRVFLATFLLFCSFAAFTQEVDPTRPLGVTTSSSIFKVKKSALTLQSIIKIGSNHKVVINGEVLKIGDTYRGYKLLVINQNGVVLESSQGKMELSLFSGVIANSQ